jgi:transposase-like protein
MANDSTYPRDGDRTPSPCAQREEHWRRVLARHRQSGLSQADFCRREEIKPNTLNWWAHELRERDGMHGRARRSRRTRRPAFVPVRVVQAMPKNGSALEVVTRSGHVIRLHTGFDAATLRQAVAALEDATC